MSCHSSAATTTTTHLLRVSCLHHRAWPDHIATHPQSAAHSGNLLKAPSDNCQNDDKTNISATIADTNADFTGAPIILRREANCLCTPSTITEHLAHRTLTDTLDISSAKENCNTIYFHDLPAEESWTHLFARSVFGTMHTQTKSEFHTRVLQKENCNASHFSDRSSAPLILRREAD